MNETKTVVVTGASSGIGKEAAKVLAAQGWTVIAHGRDAKRSAAAEAEIRSVATGRVEMIQGDLCLMSETAQMAEEIAARTDAVHVLLNNAGGMRSEFVVTDEGNETTFAGNHLGHFLLTQRLMPQLTAAGASRVINTSSEGHRHSRGIDWDDLQATRSWDSGASYCLVKLYNVLFTRELARRGTDDRLVAHAFHPGRVASNFLNHAVAATREYMLSQEMDSPATAAEPLVWLATSPEAGESSGLYWNCRTPETPAAAALDDEACTRLWAESERLVAGSLGPR